ncbi:MAG TPA: cytochrome c [Rhodothermales bacterium]|nr:cytochrome c [Rhodothermales bacterium]
MKRIPFAVVLAAVAFAGCRGMESSRPPIHVVPNMDWQERFDPQEANPFFADGRAMRMPVAGTIARGYLRADAAFNTGRSASGAYVAQMPVPLTRELLLRGQQRYNIYCSVCHGKAGDGQGIIMTGQYGYTPAPSYHEDRLRTVEDGYLYHVATNGVRSMPGYAQQVPVADRWAIVAYIRALQRSQNAGATDVPAAVRAEIEQAASANMSGGSQGAGGQGGSGTLAPNRGTAAQDTTGQRDTDRSN